MSESQFAMHSRTFSFVWHSPEVLKEVEALDRLAEGMSNISSMLAVFSAETRAVVSSKAKFGGSKFSTLTSLYKNALSLNIGVFLGTFPTANCKIGFQCEIER